MRPDTSVIALINEHRAENTRMCPTVPTTWRAAREPRMNPP